MTQHPLWRFAVLIAVVLVGAVYALPNLFGDSPALQISPRRAAQVDDIFQGQVEQALIIAGVEDTGIRREAGRMLIRFANEADRRAAQAGLEEVLGTQYTAAPTRSPNTPGWLRGLGAKPMYMGLDLRGGVHFLMQVDMEEVEKQTYQRYQSDIRGALREAGIRYRSVIDRGGMLKVTYLNEEVKRAGDALLADDFRDLDPAADVEDADPVAA